MDRSRIRPALIAAVVFAITACGSDGSSSESDDSPSTSSPRAAESGVVAGSLDETELGEPYLGELSFAWPKECSVPVVEEVLKSGRSVSLQYRLGLRGDGADVVVAFDDMRVTAMNGTEVPDSIGEAALAQFALPGFLVDRSGAVVDLVGMEALIAQLEALDPESDFEFTPELVALLEESVVSKYWGSWVGSWVAWGSFEDAVELGTSEVEIGGEIAVSEVEMESLGGVDERLVALRSTITLDGEDFVIAIGGALGTIAGAEDGPDTSQVSGQRVVTTEIVGDPATLRPSSAFTSIVVEITDDGDTQSQVEERRWTFDWESADCD